MESLWHHLATSAQRLDASMQSCSVAPHTIETVHPHIWVKPGEIAIPEMQHLFVWEATEVRILLNSPCPGCRSAICSRGAT